MWFQFDASDDPDAPGSRECHSLDAVGSTLYLFGGNDQQQRMNAILTLNTEIMKWSSVEVTGEVPIRRSAHSTALVDGRFLYVFGGWDGQEELGDLHMFDSELCVWSRVATRGTPPVPRHFHNTVVVGDMLYVFGGYDGTAWRNDIVGLHIPSKTWYPISFVTGDRPGVRASGSMCVLPGNRILVFGGYDGADFLQDLWILHTAPSPAPLPSGLSSPGAVPVHGSGHRWERIMPPRPNRRRGTAGGGGGSDRDRVEWPLARSGHACTVAGNLVFFFGGRHRQGRFNDVYVLNTDTMTWFKPTIQGKLPKPRKTHAMALVGCRMFMFGGHDGDDWLRDFHILDIEPLVKASKPVLTVPVPESSLISDLSFLLDVDISGPALLRLLKDEYSGDDESEWLFSSPVAPVSGRGAGRIVRPAPIAVGGGVDSVFPTAGGSTPVVEALPPPSTLFARGGSVMTATAGDVVPAHTPSLATHADVTFLVEGRHVRLHKAILSARSDYFRSMFSNGFHESSASVVTLSDVSYPVFIALIRFLYTDQLPPPCAESLVLPLLQQSQKMGLHRLSCLCQRQLEARLAPDNAAAMLEAADMHHAVPLRTSCIKYILQNFSQVSRSHGFLMLREDLLREVLFRRAKKFSDAPLPVSGGGDESAMTPVTPTSAGLTPTPGHTSLNSTVMGFSLLGLSGPTDTGSGNKRRRQPSGERQPVAATTVAASSSEATEAAGEGASLHPIPLALTEHEGEGIVLGPDDVSTSPLPAVAAPEVEAVEDVVEAPAPVPSAAAPAPQPPTDPRTVKRQKGTEEDGDGTDGRDHERDDSFDESDASGDEEYPRHDHRRGQTGDGDTRRAPAPPPAAVSAPALPMIHGIPHGYNVVGFRAHPFDGVPVPMAVPAGFLASVGPGVYVGNVANGGVPWVCGRCTFRNEGVAELCGMCHAHRAGPR